MLKLQSGKRWGSALIIVLSSLVFVSALTIAFLMSMRSKLVLSKSGSDAINVKMLAETAVNIAISQVRDATLKSGSQGMAWASQPGMIRLFTDTGADAGYYKLYSADDMVSDTAFSPSTEVGFLNDWDKSPAVFTDLNAPSNGVYPILDYNAASALVGGTGISLGTVPSATTDQPAPMPVKWLYVLADGSLCPAPTGSGSSVVLSATAATANNPIVGRVAFWTDDETCKVNVNTASVGTFWSTPRFNSTGDRALATSQPARGEFQRYPGHPATVSLKSVFSTLTSQQIFDIAPRLSWGGSQDGTVPVQNVTTWITTDLDRLYDSVDELLFSGTSRDVQTALTPAMVKASKFFLTASSRAPELNLFGLPRIATWPIHSANDTYYRTPDDRLLAFCSTLGTPWPAQTSPTTTPPSTIPAKTYPFYFTRQENVLPEYDISLPRNQALLSYLDVLTGADSQHKAIPGFGGNFQDKYTQAETRQILTEIFDYIRCTNLFDKTTPFTTPSMGVKNWPYAFGISTRYNKGDLDHGRGSSLGTAVPAFSGTSGLNWKTRGFGGRFLQIRSAHLQFVGLGAGISGTNKATFVAPVPVYDNNDVTPGAANNNGYSYTNSDGTFSGPAFGQLGTRQWTNPYPDLATITSALAVGDVTYNAIPYNFVGNNIPPPDTVAVQAYFYLSTLTPGEGIENWSPGHWIEITGLDNFKIELNPADRPFPAIPHYTALGFPAKGEMCIMGNMMGGGGVGGSRVASLETFAFTYAQNQLKVLTTDSNDPRLHGDPRRKFPFFSFILPVANESKSSTMAFSGGTITINIYADKPSQGTTTPYTHAKDPIETFTLTFPPTVLPTPRLADKRLVGACDKNDDETPTKAYGLNNPYERWKEPYRVNAYMNYFEDANDVLRSLPLRDGDIRQLVGPTPPTSKSFYEAQPDYYAQGTRMVPAVAHSTYGGLIDLSKNGKLVSGASYYPVYPWVPSHINGAFTDSGALGDWDNGTSIVGDGPFINAADPGSIKPKDPVNNDAYFDNSNPSENELQLSQFFSPNRQMPGPGMFGSLPTGVQRRMPWQTLLFRPGPTNSSNHPGMGSPAGGPPYTLPPDHLFLDLFWMPIVEPYAISEPFSTAGKINMNQQIVPFTYIDRMAGLRAALVSEQVAQVPKSAANQYKATAAGYAPGLKANTRFPLNLSETDGTLKQFKEKFDAGQIYRSATEICDLYLVPNGYTWPAFKGQWYGDDFALVGDNTRERPYAHLYNKLTTKSNTYTVHYRVQILQKPKTRNLTAPTSFDPSKGDKVVADQRGATTFERYLDPADDRIISKDPASYGATSLEQYYRARVINSTVFNP